MDGCFTLKDGKIHRVPVTGGEALQSPLMGLFEKRRARSFLIYVEEYDPQNPQTWKAPSEKEGREWGGRRTWRQRERERGVRFGAGR